MAALKFGHWEDHGLSLRKTRRATRRAAVTRAAVEALEERRLLTTFTIGSGTATNEILTAVTRQDDGKVIVAGIQAETSTAVLARFNADGSLDSGNILTDSNPLDSFGTGGGVIASALGQARINSLAVDPTGAIFAAGDVGTNAFVARFTSQGALDTAFNGTGFITISTPGLVDSATTMAVGDTIAIGGFQAQPDGSGGFITGTKQFLVGELNLDGSDATLFTTPAIGDGESSVNSVIFGDLGSIVAGGESIQSGNTAFTVAKYAGGSLDTDFDFDGIAITSVGSGNAIIRSLATLEGDVLAIGNADGVGLVRYDSSGTATPITPDFNEGISVLGGGVDSSDRIYVAGTVNSGTQLGSVRFSSTGIQDTGYGSGGVATSALQVGSGAQVAVSSDGTVTHATTFSNPDFNLAAGTTDSGGSPGWASDVGFATPAAEVVTANIDGSGTLTVTGTSAGENIQVRRTLLGVYKVTADGNPVTITGSGTVTGVIVNAGGGADTVVIQSSITVPAVVNGEGGNDTLSTNGTRNDILFGGDDNDTLTAGGGDDVLFGGFGDDSLVGNAGNDDLEGEAGNDTLTGGNGNDTLLGGNDDDVLSGSGGDDFLGGDSGNDTLNGGGDNDELHGGDGDDNLTGAGGDDFVFGEGNNDTLFGSAGRDVFVGGDGDDSLSGGSGRDVLVGGLGADTITGDGGDDILIAGSTSHDADTGALASIRNTWNSLLLTYPQRVANLSSGLLSSGNLMNDASIDLLSGNGGRDWFIASAGEPSDKAGNETLTII